MCFCACFKQLPEPHITCTISISATPHVLLHPTHLVQHLTLYNFRRTKIITTLLRSQCCTRQSHPRTVTWFSMEETKQLQLTTWVAQSMNGPIGTVETVVQTPTKTRARKFWGSTEFNVLLLLPWASSTTLPSLSWHATHFLLTGLEIFFLLTFVGKRR